MAEKAFTISRVKYIILNMYRIHSEIITHAQRELLNIIDRREFRKWTEERRISFDYMYKVAVGRNTPPPAMIYKLRAEIEPTRWFLSETKKLPESKPVIPSDDASIEWDYMKSAGFKRLKEVTELKKWCTKNNLKYTSLWFIAVNHRPPSYSKIIELGNIIPVDSWFYSATEYPSF